MGIIDLLAMGIEIINGTYSLPKGQGQEEEQEEEGTPIDETAPLRTWGPDNRPLAEYPE